MLEKVIIEKCKSYDSKKVQIALKKILGELDFNPKNKKILIKPNFLAAHNPKEAITTHPLMIQELCKILGKENEIFIGDSSSHDTQLALEKCGAQKLSRYAKIINFDKETKVKILTKGRGKILENFYLPKIVLEADIVISFAKLKTHGLTNMTGAIKNLYGCIPGRTKEYYHALAAKEKNFCNLLLDIYQEIKPQLAIIDGIIGLEGEGPGATGKRKEAGVIIASKNCVAADIIAARIMGFKDKEILTNELAKKRKLFQGELKIIGKLENLNFKKPKSHSIGWLTGLAGLLGKPKLHFSQELCIKCGLCEQKCPVGAINLEPYPIWDKNKCIRCLCCVEVCPKAAITKKEPFLRTLGKTLYFKIRKIS